MANEMNTGYLSYELTLATDGTVQINGQAVDVPTGADAFQTAVGLLAQKAQQSPTGTVPVIVRDGGTEMVQDFVIDASGIMTPAEPAPITAPQQVAAPTQQTSIPEQGLAGAHPAPYTNQAIQGPPLPQTTPTNPVPAQPLPAAAPIATVPTFTAAPQEQNPAPTRRRTAADFSSSRPEPAKGPAEEGWQGALNKLGLQLAAGKDELNRRDWRAAIQRGLAGHRTISVVNIKGGAAKTTDSYLLAATIGRVRGGNVVCVDNNENRGTLGDRSLPANHDHTAIDLLANIKRFDNPGNAHELQSYIRPQGENKFHVLASQNNAANREVIDGAAFVQLHHVLQSFYHLMVVDTGNASTASTWQAAVELSDELVLVAMAKEDSIKTLAATVDTLVEQGLEEKLTRGVLLLTEPPLASQNKKAHQELLRRTREHFAGYVREVVILPFDRALDDGGQIIYENLSPASKEAWLRATASIMSGL